MSNNSKIGATLLDDISALDHLLTLHCADYSDFVIAYSGGLDSHVLLHLLVQLRQRKPQLQLSAIHINHGLNVAAQQWSLHCRTICNELNVRFHSHEVELKAQAGESIEALARQARYQALAQHLHARSCLLTAHHQDDQAETVLLQLLRGAGPKGLAAMPLVQPLAQGILYRPLLQLARQQLKHYALQHQLCWIDDDSNADLQFSRNFLRHHIVPVLQQRWPAFARNLSRSARHCGQSTELLDELAQQDLNQLQSSDYSIDCMLLVNLSTARQSNVVRYWIRSLGYQVPSEAKLLTFLHNLAHSGADKTPQLHFGTVLLQRYRGRLYLLNTQQLQAIDANQIIPWNLYSEITLPGQLGTLTVTEQPQGGINLKVRQSGALSLRFRQAVATERIRPQGFSHHCSLKKLLQQWRVPPWQRGRIPLLYRDNELISVIGYCISHDIAVTQQPGLVITWQTPSYGVVGF